MILFHEFQLVLGDNYQLFFDEAKQTNYYTRISFPEDPLEFFRNLKSVSSTYNFFNLKI